jgi:hypothetical protein
VPSGSICLNGSYLERVSPSSIVYDKDSVLLKAVANFD